MAEFFDEQMIDSELQSNRLVEDIEAGAKSAPLNALTPDQFELLLACLFQNRSKEEYYDTATLMRAGADQGRDVWLTKNGDGVGLVQCKRHGTGFSQPDALCEIIKFILFAEVDSDIKISATSFRYTLALSSEPAQTTIDFFVAPAKWFDDNEVAVSNYTSKVISKFKQFAALKTEEVVGKVRQRLREFTYTLLRPDQINGLLEELPHVDKRFFKVRLVVDSILSKAYSKSQPVVDEAVRNQLNELRRSRFFPDSSIPNAVQKLSQSLQTGEYSGASAQVRADGLGKCGRWLWGVNNRTAAKAAIQASEAVGPSEDAEICKAFILSEEGWEKGLQALGHFNHAAYITAGLAIVKNGSGAQKALEWFNDAQFDFHALDTDGKVLFLLYQLECSDWSGAIAAADLLTESDFAEAPILCFIAGSIRLAQVMPNDLRQVVVVPPLNAKHFPLSDSQTSIVFRNQAAKLFRRAETAASEYGLVVCHRYGALALWLELRDPTTYQESLVELERCVRDRETSVFYISLAIAFALPLNIEEVGSFLTRELAIRPLGNFDIAYAHFAIGNSILELEKRLNYFVAHQALFEKHLDEFHVAERQVRACILADFRERANEILSSAKKITPEQRRELELAIQQGISGPPISEVEKQYNADPSTPNLLAFLTLLEAQGFSERYYELAQELLHKTQSKHYLEMVVGFLMRNARYRELEGLLSSFSALIPQSRELRFAHATVLYRNGDLERSLTEVVSLRKDGNEQSIRTLHEHLLIATGDWLGLTTLVEDGWSSRKELSPMALCRLAHLAGTISSQRLKDLIREVARIGADNADIMLKCYTLAVEFGLEEELHAIHWLHRALALSNDNGPVRTITVEEVIAGRPAWEERLQTSLESYKLSDMPLSLMALQLGRSSLEMQLSSIVTNLAEPDPRKRVVISAFSGMREPRQIAPKTIGLESTAIVTLAALNLLGVVVEHYEEIYIPHSTLTWLFRERKKLAHNQPSRIKYAKKLTNSLASESIRRFQTASPPDPSLAILVGEELAAMLMTAQSDETTFVVRSSPVHKIAGLMKETVDLAAHQDSLVSCQQVVDALEEVGSLFGEALDNARNFFSHVEERWPSEPSIPKNARLLLDNLSVHYLQTANLLDRLSKSGFEIHVPESSIKDANALVALDARAPALEEIIERIRVNTSQGISDGKIRVDKVPVVEDETWLHPNVLAVQLNGKVDAVVSDDRFHTRYPFLDGDGSTPVLTSLELLDDLSERGAITKAKLLDCRTTLRKAGYVLFPVVSDELHELLEGSTAANSSLRETAHLKAFRENLLMAQMHGWISLPKEQHWFFTFQKELTKTIIRQWKGDVNSENAEMRSNWIFNLLEPQNWAGSVGKESQLAERGIEPIYMDLAFGCRDFEDGTQKEHYSNWLKEVVFEPLDPSSRSRFLENFGALLGPHFSFEDQPAELAYHLLSQWIPEFLIEELLNDSTFQTSTGLVIESHIVFGDHVSFSRTLFFENASKAMLRANVPIEVESDNGEQWTLTRKDGKSGRMILISNGDEEFVTVDFFGLLPTSSERLDEFGTTLHKHGFPVSALGQWSQLLRVRCLTEVEVLDLTEELRQTPVCVARNIAMLISTRQLTEADLVPHKLQYYENLCGKGEVSDLEALSIGFSGLVEALLEWDVTEGFRLALLFCSHSLFAEQIAKFEIGDADLIKLAEWTREHGDLFSKVALVEVAISRIAQTPSLDSILAEIVKEILALDEEDQLGPLHLSMTLIMLVESEVSRLGTLRHWAPFRRRFATFAHANLLARQLAPVFNEQTRRNITTRHLQRFYFQNLVDLQPEPFWLPDYLQPASLKNELISRVLSAIKDEMDVIPEGALKDLFGDGPIQTAIDQSITLPMLYPGPLEGASPQQRPLLPTHLEIDLNVRLSSKQLTRDNVAALALYAAVFTLSPEIGDRACELITGSNYAFVEDLDPEQRNIFLRELAGVAGRLRSPNLARHVRGLARRYRNESNDKRIKDELLACLRAASAFEDKETWREFIGEWVNELCFSIDTTEADHFLWNLDALCVIDPKLRRTVGAGIAALRSIQ